MTISIILLVLAFFTGSFGIFRSGLKGYHRIIWCLVLGAGLTAILWWIQPNSSQTIVKQPTPEEYAKAVRKELTPDLAELANLSKKHQEELDSQFPDGFAVFGILKAGEPLIPTIVPDWLHVNWKTAGVISVKENTVTFDPPEFSIDRAEMKVGLCRVRGVTLPRVDGFTLHPIGIGALGLQFKVIHAADPVIIAMGFIKEPE